MDGRFLCTQCGADHGNGLLRHRCPACGGALRYDPSRPARFPRGGARSCPEGLWSYREALPQLDSPVTLGEPATPLLPFGAPGGCRALAKCEYLMPSGSYKDRGSTLLVSYLRERGVTEAVEDSSGNAGASLAAYAARAGMRLTVFCPAAASPGKLAQILAYGASVVRVDGPRPRATEALLDHVSRSGAVYASHLWHPLFLVGLRTLAFELVEQLGWRGPDAVVFPVGAGSILLGLDMGFRELREAGVIPVLPRLVAVQAEAVAPLFRAYRDGRDGIEPAEPRPTLAEGIAVPGPVRGADALRAIRDSGGAVVTVTESEIADGVRRLGRAGFCVEPTSAVVWHGLRRYAERAGLPGDAEVVAILSGSGLKAAHLLPELCAGAAADAAP